MVSDPVVLQALTEVEADCLAQALREYAVTVARRDGFWEVHVSDGGDEDRMLDRAIEAAMECFADRRVSGFALVAGGRRYPLGID